MLVVFVMEDYDDGCENCRNETQVGNKESQNEEETKDVSERCLLLEVTVAVKSKARVEQRVKGALKRVVTLQLAEGQLSDDREKDDLHDI